MDSNLLLRNRSVARLVVGVPEGHAHVRARIETASGDVVTLQEATLAALCRAYVDVSTHPRRRAVELRSAPVEDRKEGFAVHQLVEVGSDEASLRAELAEQPPAHPPPSMSPSAEDTDLGNPVPPPEALAAPSETTVPHDRHRIIEAAERGAVQPSDDVELDLDEGTGGDGPVFGDVPTLHSRPRRGGSQSGRRGRGEKP